MPPSVFDSEEDDAAAQSPLLLPLTVSIDDDGGQLSVPQTNTQAQLSIPREIISSGKRSSMLQAQLLRPVLAGTYLDEPAYLVRLQLQLSLSAGGNQTWFNRIQSADIHVQMEDGPRDEVASARDGEEDSDEEEDETDDDYDEELLHPSIVKAFPGPNGWEGTPHSAERTTQSTVGVQLGYDLANISYNIGGSQTRTETRAVKVKVAHRGPGLNILHVRVEENAVDKAGVPDYLVVPFIVTHRTRRFRMRLAVHARYGLWRGKAADMLPILGRADDPLYFDPTVMKRLMDKGRRGANGEKIVEWHGLLDDTRLEEYSSLGASSANAT
ncbi:hypothetical protein LIA77_00515 [Sarocladium implicatum]|nr:hypothetical protein LIA77_00515 [Sarocladium implicatum]